MLPKFYGGQKVLMKKKWFFCSLKVRDIVVLKDPRSNSLIIKRINQIKNNLFYVLGDNKKGSTDSRVFGWVKKNLIVGKVIYTNNI
jgi:type IV secretory pathway protease TraF